MLEDKLRELLVKLGEQIDPQGYEDGDIDGTVGAIKQIFTEEGYHRAANLAIYKDGRAHHEFKTPSGRWVTLMTGAEWLERFKSEYRTLSSKAYSKDRYAKMAAERAAGL